MKTLYKIVQIILILSFSILAFSQGQDDASNSPYLDGWDNGDNGGTGFYSWNLWSDGNGGRFIGSSDIDVDGKSWGMWANSGGTSNSVRAFSSTPSPLDRISVHMDNGSIQTGGSVGIGLQNSNYENLLEIFFTGGGSQYQINDNSGINNTPMGYTGSGLAIEIELLSSTTFKVILTNLSNSNSEMVTGTLLNPAGGQTINQIRFFNYNAGDGSSNDQFFNNLKHELNVVLPLSSLNFEACKNGNNVLLRWNRPYEKINNFLVQRSLDGNIFTEIGVVESTVERDQTQLTFYDRNPQGTRNYYRLEYRDSDGHIEYSPLKLVILNRNIQPFLYPNPAQDYLIVESNDLPPNSISILDNNGKRMYFKEKGFEKKEVLDISGLSPGSYILHCETNGSTQNHLQFIKK